MQANNRHTARVAGPLYGVLLTTLSAISGPHAKADELRDVVERTLAPSYPFIVMRAETPLEPGTAEWEKSLDASVDGVMKILPADCAADRFPLTICGLGMTHVGSDAMAPTLRVTEAVFFEPYSDQKLVQRGDVVVFNIPVADQPVPTRHVFRAIGLPGETSNWSTAWFKSTAIPQVSSRPAKNSRGI